MLLLNGLLGLRDFPSIEDVPNPTPTSKVRPRQFEQNAESIFILPGLELSFQTRQLNGKILNSIQSKFNILRYFSFFN